MSLEYPPTPRTQDIDLNESTQIYDLEDSKKTEVCILPKNADTLNPKNLAKTKPCRFYKTCRKDTCLFAHSISELRLPLCFFGKNCKKKRTCKFLHPEETVKQRYHTVGKLLPELPEN